MTRILTMGFEEASRIIFNLQQAFNFVNPGPYSNYYVSLFNGTAGFSLSGTITDFYIRFRGAAGGGGGSIHFYEGITKHLQINIYEYGIRLYRNTTLIHTWTPVIDYALWHLYEFHCIIGDDVSIEAKVDGASLATATHLDTQGGGTGVIDRIYLTGSGSAGGNQLYMDDLAINDTSGTKNNTWIGAGYIIGKLVNGTGDLSQLVGSDGNSVNNYQQVDEVPYNTSDYNSSSTPDEADLYTVEDITLAADEAVNAIAIYATAKNLTSGYGALKLGIKTSSEDWGDENVLSDGSWSSISKGYEVDPADSGEFTQAKINALQIGAKIGTGP